MVNEYKPNGGWMNYYRKKKVVEHVKVVLTVAVLLAFYAVVGYIDRGM